MNLTQAHRYGLISFSLTLSLGLIFLFLILPQVWAADVNINSSVISPRCGDSNVDVALGEVCDDGNTTDCDGCKGDCSRADNVCGDGIKECGEECEIAADCGAGVSCNRCICGVPCFLAGTQISLADGEYLPIEEVKAGDLVVSYNELEKQLEPALVLKTFEHQASQYLIINDELRVTARHLLYVNSQWLEAGRVGIGDKFLSQDGQPAVVSSVETKTGDFLVYNLEIEKNHNYFAQGYLVHNQKGCIPNCVGKECGPDGCFGSCGNCGAGEICIGGQCISQPYCGDGAINQPSEECDDGNTVSGDGCSATCQLEGGCGDGNLDPGEECDDDNIISGDCCSASCKIELHIRYAAVSSIGDNSAIISWTTYSWQNNACELAITDSTLDWGQDIPPTEGTVSLSGADYSYQLTSLDSGAFYHFLITASLGLLQDTYSSDFRTTCTPGWECTHGPCQPNGKWIVTCVDQMVPKCQPDYDYEADCECELLCGVCQHPDDSCSTCLADDPPCCGNGVCEPPTEDPYNCPQDCPLGCIPVWECTDWGPCIDGVQIRQCYDLHACGTNLGRPDEVRGCGECTISCGFCQNLNIEQCICEELVPCCGNGICELGETHENCPQDCVEVCIPEWVPTGWSECINNRQVRTYIDLNNCPYALAPPPDKRSCGDVCEVACGFCQQLDLANCTCLIIVPCCGNGICEIEFGENTLNCPVDCGLPPDLRLTLPQCLDGLDNDNDGLVDYPADPGCSSPYDNSELNLAEILRKIGPINKMAAPVLVAAIALNTFATFSFFNFLSYLQFFFTQPLAALFRRKRKKWGVVYNSLSKQPVDLAIVRLYRQENAQLIQSRVTDKLGRYNFLVSRGRYYLTVTKPKFTFPTEYLKEAKEDVKYLDLYHGETIEVTEENFSIVLNIPIDPIEETQPATKIIFQQYLRQIQKVVAFSAVPLAAISVAISPGALTFALLGVHCLLFALFYRLGYQRPPKSWGKIFDLADKKSISRAIARIYDKQYNKLLETRVTDGSGRYSFLVNNNIYYLTAEKGGYQSFKSGDIDLVKKDRETIVGLDVGLKKGKSGEVVSASAEDLACRPDLKPTPLESVISSKAKGQVVGRESLQGLLKTKEEIGAIEEDIDQKQEEPEVLQDKVENIQPDIDKRLAELDQDQLEQKPIEPDNEEPRPEEREDKPSQPPPEKSIFG